MRIGLIKSNLLPTLYTYSASNIEERDVHRAISNQTESVENRSNLSTRTLEQMTPRNQYMKKLNKLFLHLVRNKKIQEKCCLLAGESNPALPRSGDGGFRH